MSHSYNSQEVQISPSIMTFRDYYMAFVGIKESHLANGWGWFVDIELNYEATNNLPNNHIKYNPYKNVSIPKTINEYPSIRSMKSMKNLSDSAMIFKMDEDSDKHRTNTLYVNTFGLISIALICFSIFI